MSSLSKNILQTFRLNIPTIFLGVVAGIFITRLLGPEGKGVYTLFQANAQLLSVFLGVSFAQSMIYFISNKKIPKKYVFGNALAIIFLASIISFALIFIDNPIQSLLIPEEYRTLFFKWYFFFNVPLFYLF